MDVRCMGDLRNNISKSCFIAFSFVIYYVILWGRWVLFLALDLG